MVRRKFRRKIKVETDSSEESTVAEAAREIDARQSIAETDGVNIIPGAQAQETNGGEGESVKDDGDLLTQVEKSVSGMEQVSPEQELLERLKQEAEDNYDKYLRAVAELENYKKRAMKERSDYLRYAGENIARDILDVVDDLTRAVEQNISVADNEFHEGIKLILNRLNGVLSQHQIRGVSAVGQNFDPQKHEAIAIVPTSEHKPGIVIEELKQAFFFKDKLLRPAQVVVSAELPAEAEEALGSVETLEGESKADDLE